MAFEPKFTITPRIASSLMRIEAAKQAVEHLPITPSVLASLRESARLFSTHYSTMIEGNRLTQEQVTQVIAKQEHFPGRDRDEREVLGWADENSRFLRVLGLARFAESVALLPSWEGVPCFGWSRTRWHAQAKTT